MQPADGKVLFVVDEENVATRYRCDHQVEQLAFASVPSDVVRSEDVDRLDLESYAVVILVRVEWSDHLAAFVERARARGCSMLFDTDDLLFEPELTHHLAFARNWPEADLQKLVEKRDRYRRTLDVCDGATVSTEPLALHARRHVARAMVTPNAVTAEMVQRADGVLSSFSAKFRRLRRRVTVGYFSGTRTHDRDFLEAADAVLWALAEFSSVRLLVVGKLELDERFDRWSARITRLPLQAWSSLPSVIARTDVNIAPLEPSNPITECKSCVKYLEAGLLAVPTVASRRPDYVRAVADGETGMLVDTPGEWRNALACLIESRALRSAMGEAARDDVRATHTTAALAPSLDASLTELRPQPSHRSY
jgi:O-antigen biosynthesis protein